ncbi:alpha/beta-hydrolase [Lactarius deliciosus]|nr:alpha/beta-hydrolase [Lactarius deliciosus]
MSSEQPFKIAVPDDALALLKRKLDDTRLPDEVDAAEWAYGAPLADIRRLVSRWKDGYDWRTHERKLNVLPMFTRTIAVDGFGELNVHYIHKKSAAKGAIPLLFVHGFAHVRRARKLPRSDEGTAAFDIGFRGSTRRSTVVAPSLPGYAWSEGVLENGFHAKYYAELTLTTASLYGPKHVKASHTNLPMCEPPKFFKNPIVLLKCLITSFTQREREAAAHSQNFFKNGMGYFAEQTTKPQTIGFSLADSPIGLLAWIYEKLVAYTDAYPWTDDEVLTWISIYWFSRAGPAASVRIYYEARALGRIDRFSQDDQSRSACPSSPRSSPGSPNLLRSKGKIVFESEHKVGGHFAAYEQPEALVGDLRKMFGKSGPAAGVVSGRSGY